MSQLRLSTDHKKVHKNKHVRVNIMNDPYLLTLEKSRAKRNTPKVNAWKCGRVNLNEDGLTLINEVF